MALHSETLDGSRGGMWPWLGQRVTAVVEPRPGETITLDELVEHARTRLAGYKAPRELHLVSEMPRHPSGKPDYKRARAVIEQDTVDQAPTEESA